MPSDPKLQLSDDFRDMLGQLRKSGVEFLVVGGYAVGVHHRPRATGDIDIWVRPTPQNAQRLWQALTTFGAPLHDVSPEDFARMGLIYQMGRPPHRIDLLTSLDAVTFDEAWSCRMEFDIDGVNVPLISRDHLIRNKQATGRSKDLEDVRNLRRPNPRKTGPE